MEKETSHLVIILFSQVFSSQFLTVKLHLDKSTSHSFSARLKLPLLPYFLTICFSNIPQFFTLVSLILYLVQLNSTSAMAVMTRICEAQIHPTDKTKYLQWKPHISSYSYGSLKMYAEIVFTVLVPVC